MFTTAIAHGRLTRNGVTSWDKDEGFSVTHEIIGVPRVLAAIVFFFAILLLVTIGNITSNRQSDQTPNVSPSSQNLNTPNSSNIIDPYADPNFGSDLDEPNPFADPNFDGSEKNTSNSVSESNIEAVEVRSAYDAYNKGDYFQALELFQSLAEQGDANAQVFLGFMYDTGQGVTQNYKQAVDWYRKAVAQGNVDAINNLGFMYVHGHGVTQDYKHGADWLRKAAEQGHIVAQASLGSMYDTGQGVTQNYMHAYMWVSLAAAKGDKVAVNLRDTLSTKMTKNQILEAQKFARECEKRNYKQCD
jgi:TPR repeat protein